MSATISVNNLTKIFNDHTAVDHISFEVPSGQICGYLGPNGAGKTTTVKMLTGTIKPNEGKAAVAGFDIRKDPLQVKKAIGYVPESGALYENLTPHEYLSMIGALYHLTGEDLENKIDLLNEIKNTPMKRYKTINGKLTAQTGNYHIA